MIIALGTNKKFCYNNEWFESQYDSTLFATDFTSL